MMAVDESVYDDDYIKDGVKLILEETEGTLEITYADLNPSDTYHLVILLVDRLAGMTGQEYNQVLEDLREVPDD